MLAAATDGELNWAKEGGNGEVAEKSLRNEPISNFPVPGRNRAGPFLACRSRSVSTGKKNGPNGGDRKSQELKNFAGTFLEASPGIKPGR